MMLKVLEIENLYKITLYKYIRLMNIIADRNYVTKNIKMRIHAILYNFV